MQNEDRIVELLAESLKKQDQHSELLTLLVKSDEKQNLILEQVVHQIQNLNGKVESLNGKVENLNGKVENLNGKIDGLRTDFNKMFSYLQTKHDKLEDRTKRLEDGFFKA
ncbi:MAG: hypothetical protein WA960_04470 [Tunicatimonas sp.]